MEFAGSLVGALIAVIGALAAGYSLYSYERRTRQKDERERLLKDLIFDLERNKYQLDGDPMRIEDGQVWWHSGMETRSWWDNRALLDFLDDDLQSLLRDCIYELDDLNRVLADLRQLNKPNLDAWGDRPVRRRFGDSNLDCLKVKNGRVLSGLKGELKKLQQTKVSYFGRV